MMCSEIGPRISFSGELGKEEEVGIASESIRDSSFIDSSSEFEFSICSSFGQESCSADELFANGMILPIQFHESVPVFSAVKLRNRDSPPLVSLPPLPATPDSVEKSRKQSKTETMALSSDNSEDKTQTQSQSKSFWSFKRSSSLNCDIKKSLICSLPILSRSNSTGSVPPNPKRTTMLKDVQKQSSNSKQTLTPKPPSSSSCRNGYGVPQKPPLRKNNGGSYNNGVRISPVLNVPPPYISKGTANLFGFGSLLRNGSKDKKNKKK
ncbi:uncharacterized protein LOC110823434 [Carica papaya]|uniref:uncharacterized protein LOC110823434 n=1 Tax=Carica papaya TaxID=3649 RepID=UPI000B8CAFFE|nr:uncharacterized protein LOC110823434 [Carica papaya]